MRRNVKSCSWSFELTPEEFLVKLPERGLHLSLSPSGKLAIYGEQQALTERIAHYIELNKERLIALVKRKEEQPGQNVRTHADASNEDSISRCDACQCTLAESDFAHGRVHVDESRADVYCMACWQARNGANGPEPKVEQHETSNNDFIDADGCIVRMVPAGMTPSEYIDAWYATPQEHEKAGTSVVPAKIAQDRCSKHGKPYTHSDEYGGRYCSHVDCWDRYRLMLLGANAGYPALDCVIDCRDHLADTSKSPLYHTERGIPIYPSKPVVTKHLVDAGSDAWRVFVQTSHFIEIDQAVKTVLAMQLENVLQTPWHDYLDYDIIKISTKSEEKEHGNVQSLDRECEWPMDPLRMR